MSLHFRHFCDLLTQLESFSARQPPLTRDRCEFLFQQTITQWFRTYDVSIHSTHVDAVIVLSALLPARRTDRVYALQAPSLSRKLRRCLRLGEGRWQQLDQWKVPGRGDLGDCVERLQAQSEAPIPLPGQEITLAEVDRALEGMAKACRFSAPSVKENENSTAFPGVDSTLERIYHRLQSREAKWFTRMILKDYPSFELREGMVLRCLDSRLPTMMKNQDNFQSAINSLRNLGGVKNVTSTNQENAEVARVPVSPIPKIGVKVGRTTYLKGRSIKHAVSMIGGRAMSAERKYDGEYFQIHVDLTKDKKWIQVFSKSGKDSTRDRKGIHGIVKDSLRIGRKDCGFSRNCILEGEMVIWDDETKEILDFHKIRKHVSRTGVFLGTASDSPPHAAEHLMLIYYDIMLLDDDPVLKKPQTSRRRLLEKLVKPLMGRAKLATGRTLQLGSSNEPKQLLEFLAQAFVNGWEGLVLKPSNEPYFINYNERPIHQYASCWIKLKKDYIAGLGDTADFAVFGAGYSNGEAVKLGHPGLKWTHFHLGCLKNKKDVSANGAIPEISIFVAISQCMKVEDVKTLNQLGQFQALTPYSKEVDNFFVLDIQPGVPKMSVVFKKPFVFEVLGSGFDKVPNQGFFTLRFPRVVKVHWDRSWKESVTFDELQQMAKEAKMAPSGDVSADVRSWIEKLNKTGRGADNRLALWDDSEEEFSIEDVIEPEIARSKKRLAAALLVRVDTAEMIPGDSRLSSGEIIEQENTQQPPITSDNGSLLALSSASPSRQLMSELNSEEGPVVQKSTFRHKRTSEIPDSESSRVAKRMRQDPPSLSTTENTADDSVLTDEIKSQPLQHITNFARPRETPAIKSSKTPVQPEFNLVQKLRVDTYNRPRPGARRPLEDSSSHCTTDRGSESTPRSNVTSQIGATQSQPLEYDTPTQRANLPTMSPPSENDTPIQRANLPTTISPSSEHDVPAQRPNLPKPTSPPPDHNTTTQRANPPTTINPNEPRKKPNIPIPNLPQTGVILCPCIANIAYLTENLLTSPQIPTSHFPASPTLPPPAPPGITPPYSKTAIILIESNREAATVNLLQRLVNTMTASTFDEIQLWDWRLLESLKKVSLCEGYMEKVRRKRFFARLGWGEGGCMRVEWGEGSVTNVPPKYGMREVCGGKV